MSRVPALRYRNKLCSPLSVCEREGGRNESILSCEHTFTLTHTEAAAVNTPGCFSQTPGGVQLGQRLSLSFYFFLFFFLHILSFLILDQQASLFFLHPPPPSVHAETLSSVSPLDFYLILDPCLASSPFPSLFSHILNIYF